MNEKITQALDFLRHTDVVHTFEMCDVYDKQSKHHHPQCACVYVFHSDPSKTRPSFDFSQLQGVQVLVVDDDCMLHNIEIRSLPASLRYLDMTFQPSAKYGTFFRDDSLEHLVNLEVLRLPRMYMCVTLAPTCHTLKSSGNCTWMCTCTTLEK